MGPEKSAARFCLPSGSGEDSCNSPLARSWPECGGGVDASEVHAPAGLVTGKLETYVLVVVTGPAFHEEIKGNDQYSREAAPDGRQHIVDPVSAWKGGCGLEV